MNNKAVIAIHDNDIVMLSSLLSKGQVDFGDSPAPLLLASQLGRVQIIALLLDAGADIDAVDEQGLSSCHYAIYFNEFDALRLLLARGANVSRPTERSLIGAAAGRLNAERFVIELLDAGAPLDHLTHEDFIALLVNSQSIPLLTRMLARNVDVSALRDLLGRTLLHRCVHHNVHTDEFLRALVHLGRVDVNAVDQFGQTPLHRAAVWRTMDVDLVHTLFELGVNVDQQDGTGRTALFSAILAGACAELLLILNTDVTLATVDGFTACHVAAEMRRAQLCKVVALGGDVDQPDNKGETPRMIAIRRRIRLPTTDEIDAVRRDIAKKRLDLVRKRAFQICVGLQSLRLNALQLCEIMTHSFGAFGCAIAFHHWWAIATAVKHFR